MRPIPWMLRLGLFAVGFGIGLSHSQFTSPKRPIVIEVQFLPETASGQPSRETSARPDVSLAPSLDEVCPVTPDNRLRESPETLRTLADVTESRGTLLSKRL